MFYKNLNTKGIDSDDFEKEVEGDGIERTCDTLIICILTSIYNGIYLFYYLV